MAIPSLTGQAPIGTVIRISITVPGRNNGRSDGFAYTVNRTMTVDELRRGVDRELLPTFFEEFLPAD